MRMRERKTFGRWGRILIAPLYNESLCFGGPSEFLIETEELQVPLSLILYTKG